MNRPWPLVLFAGLLVAGCATLNSVTSDVHSYSQWPQGRKPSSYAFERLPSQQARPERQQTLEAAAREALKQAGFAEAGGGEKADVTVQVGSTISRFERSPWDDPFWWRGGFYPYWYGRGAFWGPSLSLSYQSPRYEREVALLIRDAQSGQVLYETRAASDGYGAGDATTYAAMFEAALKDFPQPTVNPRRVSVQLPSG